jgi:hypothetical protein
MVARLSANVCRASLLGASGMALPCPMGLALLHARQGTGQTGSPHPSLRGNRRLRTVDWLRIGTASSDS